MELKCCSLVSKVCCFKSCEVQVALNLKVKVYSLENLRGFLSVCVCVGLVLVPSHSSPHLESHHLEPTARGSLLIKSLLDTHNIVKSLCGLWFIFGCGCNGIVIVFY